jgi:hypothetical protein
MLTAEAKSTLFLKFAECGMQQIRIIRITPTSRERPLS